MSKETGGTAFPHDSNWEDRQGMTLRDYFAAKAMQGIIANPNAGGMTYTEIADRSYEQADAMLKARKNDTHTQTAFC